MTISRWKVMAGMLGISLGGLAALAGQGPKDDDTARNKKKPAPAPAPVLIGDPVEAPKLAAPPVDVPVPMLPAITPAALTLPAVPASPVVPPPVAIDPPKMPAVAATPPAPLPSLDEPKFSTKPLPVKVLAPEIKVELPPVKVELPAAPVTPEPLPTPAFAAPAVVPAAPVVPVAAVVPAAPVTPTPVPTPAVTPTAPPVVADAGMVKAASKYRILLRVGEGEPMFEVRSGDDLVLKVLCEKVDVKSPTEKGQSLSAVKASGKVRFVGFGAEGTCDELSFLAGTGEVQLAGTVKIQVKDKLGRVDTELTAEKMHYRLDASAMPGTLRP